MSKIIGTCKDSKTGGWWEIHSDGKAYSDQGEVAYRWSDGTWNTKMVRTQVGGTPKFMVDDSDKLERAYSRFVAGLIVGQHPSRNPYG